jgi:hypothetical protein
MITTITAITMTILTRILTTVQNKNQDAGRLNVVVLLLLLLILHNRGNLELHRQELLIDHLRLHLRTHECLDLHLHQIKF